MKIYTARFIDKETQVDAQISLVGIISWRIEGSYVVLVDADGVTTVTQVPPSQYMEIDESR